ncbi:MAG TPA: CaiB/BaiF CoA-transferase family protein [Candidatus Dormibacteraeota bacterium]|nr:CaiB/BaiF CoA-transferase family protein [Candidatus Dormibacteraeota bacterium]
MSAAAGPLAGLTVLELGQIYNGPYCGLLLAHHGAEVIKVEAPQGDVLRRMDRSPGGASYPFLMLNANKRGVRIDLKQPAGVELLLRLAAGADVLVENFAAGVADRLGVGADAVRARNPRLVYASGSGFGSSGPYVGYPAMDFTIQALVGAMSITGYPEQPPVKCGPTFIDMLGAVHLFAGILLALGERERSGCGQRVEVAMFDAAVPALLSFLAPYYELQREMSRSGNRHVVGGATPYNNFPCVDGYVAILCVSDQHWLDLCEAMARPDLGVVERWHSVAGRGAESAAIEAEVAAWTAPQTRAAVAARVAGAGIPSAPVRTISEVGSDRHVFERGVVREVTTAERGAVKVLGTPIKLGAHPEPTVTPPPAIGADTEAVLRERLALSAGEIAALRAAGTI